MPVKKYEFIFHTADLGIKVEGKSLAKLFTNAAYALFDIMTDIKDVVPSHQIEINLTADSIEDLMNYWLSHLLQQWTINNYLLSDFKIQAVNETSIRGLSYGEPFDKTRHRINKEIKAITFHELRVAKDKSGWNAQIIFDI